MLRLKGKALFQVQTARREGSVALPKRSLGFIGYFSWMGEHYRKRHITGKRGCCKQNFTRWWEVLVVRTTGGCGQAVQWRKGVSRLQRSVEVQFSFLQLGPTQAIHLGIIDESTLN